MLGVSGVCATRGPFRFAGHLQVSMRFPISKLGIVLVVIFIVVIGTGVALEKLDIIQGESGPRFIIGPLFFLSLILSLPSLIVSFLVPFQIPSTAGYALNIVLLYFIGAGIQKLFSRG